MGYTVGLEARKMMSGDAIEAFCLAVRLAEIQPCINSGMPRKPATGPSHRYTHLESSIPQAIAEAVE